MAHTKFLSFSDRFKLINKVSKGDGIAGSELNNELTRLQSIIESYESDISRVSKKITKNISKPNVRL